MSGYFGLDNVLLRYLLSARQGIGARRGYDRPLINDMGVGMRSTNQRRGAANKLIGKNERRVAKAQSSRRLAKGKGRGRQRGRGQGLNTAPGQTGAAGIGSGLGRNIQDNLQDVKIK
jgi:hypothetical protein